LYEPQYFSFLGLKNSHSDNFFEGEKAAPKALTLPAGGRGEGNGCNTVSLNKTKARFAAKEGIFY